MGGAIVTEGIFNIPGVGYALYQAIVRARPDRRRVRDRPGVIFIVDQPVVDLLYAVLDPRIRYV